MPSKRLEIHLGYSQSAYAAGQRIAGFVLLRLTRNETLSSLRVQLYGAASINWLAARKLRGRIKVYVDATIELWQSTSPGGETFHPGCHSFAFDFLIPANCATSCEGRFAKILYFIKATLDFQRNWAVNKSQSVRRGILVNAISNLNDSPHLADGIVDHGVKHLELFSCAPVGEISATFGMQRQGYVPGDMILFDLDVYSNCRRDTLCQLSIELVQEISTAKISGDVRVISAARQKVDLKAEECLAVRNQVFRLPNIIAPFLNCDIISLNYYLRLTVKPDTMFASSLTLRLPVFIGTVPFDDVAAEMISHRRRTYEFQFSSMSQTSGSWLCCGN